jgi:hypothetical protein
MQVKVREDDEGTFVKFSRPVEKIFSNEVKKLGPPRVLILVDEAKKHDIPIDGTVDLEGKYAVFTGKIGNGSLVNCKVSVYDNTKNDNIGHTLETVAVEVLVPYVEGKTEDNFGYPF